MSNENPTDPPNVQKETVLDDEYHLLAKINNEIWENSNSSFTGQISEQHQKLYTVSDTELHGDGSSGNKNKCNSDGGDDDPNNHSSDELPIDHADSEENPGDPEDPDSDSDENLLKNFNAVELNRDDILPYNKVDSQAAYEHWIEADAPLFKKRYFKEYKDTTTKPKDNTSDQATVLNGYHLIKLLGQGGFGLVVLAQKEKGLLCAMKCMSKQKIKDRKMIKYIIAERRCLSAVNHPLIVGLIDKFKDNSNIYLIMPFIECGDLYRLVQSRRLKRFTHDEAKFYVAQVYLVFEYLHKNRIVYRDLKPENIMLDRTGFIQLADLGFAKMLADGGRTYSTLGTPDYMAPEIFGMEKGNSRGYTFSVDWWTVGCLLFEFLVGFPPFHDPDGNTLSIIKKVRFQDIKFPSFLKTEAKDLIFNLCQKNVTRRLGCGKGGPTAVKEHYFFENVNFIQLFQRQGFAPHRPEAKDERSFYTGRPVPKNFIKVSDTNQYPELFEAF